VWGFSLTNAKLLPREMQRIFAVAHIIMIYPDQIWNAEERLSGFGLRANE
jgi:hypothetical protein